MWYVVAETEQDDRAAHNLRPLVSHGYPYEGEAMVAAQHYVNTISRTDVAPGGATEWTVYRPGRVTYVSVQWQD